MSNQVVVCVFDSKAGAFLPPVVTKNTEMAVRQFKTAFMQEGSDFARWPGDYTLFEIGEWDDEGGFIYMYEAKKNLGTVSELLSEMRRDQIAAGGI